MDFHHGVGEDGGRASIPDAEPGHGESLGKAVQEDRALLHSRQRGDGDVLGVVVGQFAVNLVGEDHEVVLDAKRRDLRQLLAGLRAAGWVGREIEHQHAAAGCDLRGDGFRRDAELVFRTGGDRHGNAVGEDDARVVAHITRLVVEHFIAGIQDGAQGQVDRLGNANGHDHLGLRIIRNAEMFLDVFGDGGAQGGCAEVGSVARAALFQGVNGGFADVPGRVEVWLANAKRDDVRHALHDLKEVANPGFRDRPYVVGDVTLGVHCFKKAIRRFRRFSQIY